ncbi:hypothetical protein I317_02788 [Kwoniella heveanensis CBS 569]|uniref:Uncharacterized protein n=1 Tax=Kwoniella heveanensis BCC8398 TaxID=1296120 RepID=A0A1B9GKN5_9TREE|nr:hypothetical protein I316_06677 [Kwoniella heveanensis BCC8398]OCF43350.1 hypothetical protein I317_02788 [Kwoniella heveanensis CBS 569]
MSKKPTELEAAALTSWTPAGQAALYHIHLAQQAERDEQKTIKEAEKKEKKVREEIRPEEVVAGEVVDGWIKEWCPALYDFLDLLAPPHLAIGLFALLHFVFWQSYWCIVGVIEYLEILLFRDQARALIWWPKIKAISCIVLYSVIENEPILDSKGRPKGKRPIFGAIKLIEKFLPSPPKSKSKDKEKDKDKEEDKAKGKGKDKDKDDKHKNKSKGSSNDDKKGKDGKDKTKDKDKDKDKGKDKK